MITPSVASHPTKEHQVLVEDTARGIEHSIDSYVDEVLENDSVSDIDEDYEYFKSATRRGFGSLTAITNNLNDYSEDTLQRLQGRLMMDNGFRNNDFGMVMAHALRDKADEQQVRNYTALYGRINDIYRGEH